MEQTGSPSPSPVLPRRNHEPPSSKSADEQTTLGRVRLGRYRIVGPLGRGGMGAVYEAQDTLLKRRVAVKLLPKQVSTNAEALARFLREAQVAARLNHPNVVAVYDIGKVDGSYYIVMELVRGVSAQELLAAHGPFHWSEATNILTDVCQGAAAAHQAGMIHRDIKPSNILRSADGTVKLADFGLAKSAGVTGTTITAQGEVVGTPHYMSPEQSRSSPLDERTDIYSLGATYFALLTGRPPYLADHSMQVLMAHCGSEIPDPRAFVADIPEQCTVVIKKAMAKDRSDRYANVGELLADLAELQTARPADVPHQAAVERTLGVDAPTNPLSFASAYLAEKSSPRGGKRRRNIVRIITGIGLICLVAAIVGVATSGRRSNEPTPPASATRESSTVAAEMDQALRTRDVALMQRVSEKVQRLLKGSEGQDPGTRESLRRARTQLEKAIAFRERITEKGLALGLDGHATCIKFSPDDRWVVVSQGTGAGGVIVFDSRTGEKAHSLWQRKGNRATSVQTIAVAHDNSVIAAGCADNRVRLWHFGSGTESQLQLPANVQSVAAVAFAPNRRRLVAGLEPMGDGKGRNYLKIWDLDTNRDPFAFKVEHAARVGSVDFTAGGHQVASGSDDKRIVMWNADTGRIWREIRTGFAVRTLTCSPQGRMLVTAGAVQTGHVIQFWDYPGERLIAAKQSPHGECNCAAFNRDGSLLATSSGSHILLWDPESQLVRARLSGHGQNVTALAFSTDGTILASGSADETLRLWDLARCLSTNEKPRSP